MKRKKITLRDRKPETKPSGDSQYARKRAYLDKHDLWGWEVLSKPWK